MSSPSTYDPWESYGQGIPYPAIDPNPMAQGPWGGSGGFTAGLQTKNQQIPPSADYLASENYTTKRIGMTVDASSVAANQYGHKWVKGGTIMAKNASTGKYGPYISGDATWGAPSGLLFPGDIDLAYGDTVCGLLVDGWVLAARVPGYAANDTVLAAAFQGRINFQ